MPVMKGWNILTNSEKTKKARYFAVISVVDFLRVVLALPLSNLIGDSGG